MKCKYCNKKTDKWFINWEGLKGYSMCKICGKDESLKYKFFIERKLKEMNSNKG